MNAVTSSSLEQWIIDATQEIAARGRSIELPLIATCANISSTRPVTVRGGTPVASLFDHPQDAGDYWLQADLALQNALVTIFRWTAEPFYYDNGEIGGWLPFSVAHEFERQARKAKLGIRSCIVAPIHLPGGVIGAVGWGTDQPDVAVRRIFEQHAAELHVLALRFVSACNTAMYGEPQIRAYHLTRREVQCVKLAAAGKTDEEIATILDLAIPTVRFHLKRAGEKLGESGRVRIVHHAAALGFIGMRL